MRPAARSGIAPLLTAVVAASLPTAAAAQLASVRPASVSLTVVVPPPDASPVTSLAAVEPRGVVRLGANVAEVEAMVGIRDRVATRVEVSLGRGWPAEAGRVWVRNSRGALERLDAHGRVVALDQSPGAAVTPSLVQFHVESNRLLPTDTFEVPVEYRVRVGSGEGAATWTFPSKLRVDAVR